MKVEIQNTKIPLPKRLPEIGELFRLKDGHRVYMRVMDEIGRHYFNLVSLRKCVKNPIYIISMDSGDLFWLNPDTDIEMLQPVGGILKVELIS